MSGSHSGRQDVKAPACPAILEVKSREVKFQKKFNNTTKPFVFWDGEAVQDGAGYCLLGNSAGGKIQGPNLGTEASLDLLLSERKRIGPAFHVAFAFDYDVNNILRELSWPHLIQLKETGKTKWHGYRIKHIPHKSFSVSRGGVSIRIDDVFSFFRCRFDRALDKYDIGKADVRRRISEGKDLRPNFKYNDLDSEIVPYWKYEMAYGVLLMDRIRKALNGAGFFIGNWHGPGALAGYALNQHRSFEHMVCTQDHILTPARIAYAGGWFERFKAGVYLDPIYTADLNSAYAFALSRLPSLKAGEWRHTTDDSAMRTASKEVRLGLFRLSFDRSFSEYMATSHGIPLPLFQRSSGGGISRPTTSAGWYWNFEARLVANSSKVTFHEAYVFEDDGSYPFEWVDEMFLYRLALQAENNPIEIGFKWALASAYGRLAQRAGWDRRNMLPPKWHQIEWAGAITSWCRSMIFMTALPVALRGGLISIDTDGITSTCPFPYLPRGEGNQLGRWKVEQYSGIIYIQNGVYWLRDMHGNWKPPKTRGLPSGALDDPDIAISALESDGIIRLTRHNFVGYGSAMHGRRDRWRTWEDSDYAIDVHHSGSRQHVRKICRACQRGESMVDSLHDLALVPSADRESSPHRLPWLEPPDTATDERLRHEIAREFM